MNFLLKAQLYNIELSININKLKEINNNTVHIEIDKSHNNSR